MGRKEMIEKGLNDNIYTIAQLEKLRDTGLDLLVSNNKITEEDKTDLLNQINDKLLELEGV